MNQRTVHRRPRIRHAARASIALLALVACAAPCAADVPASERLPPDALAPIGFGSTAYAATALQDRALVLASFGGSYWLCECVRSPAGTWDASSYVLPPGMTSISSDYGRVEGNGLDAAVLRWSRNGAHVLVRQGGAWSIRGSISVPSWSVDTGPFSLGLTDDASQVVSVTRQRWLRWRWDGAGYVLAEERTAAQLGFRSLQATRVGGDYVVVCGEVPSGAPTEAGPAGAFRLVAFDLRDPSAPLGAPQRLPASAASSGTIVAAGGPWVAYVDAQPGNPAFSVRILERVADGTFVQRGAFASSDPQDKPASISRSGVLSLQRAVVVRGGDGAWRRGVALVPNDCRPAVVLGDGSGAVAFSSPASAQLRTWDRPLDRDRDGVRDVDQLAGGASADCNRNGIADALDLAAGRLVDANGDGIPDACAADCDANGVPDLAQVRDGARAACDGVSLAACAIAAGAPDLDRDGVPDACGPDRNRNGVPDAVEVANGALDCDHDGIPNGVPLGGLAADGVPIASIGLYGSSSWGPALFDSMLATYYPIDRPTRIDSVRFHVAVGADLTASNSLYGKQYSVFVAQDTGGASLPDARLRWSAIGNYGATDWHAVQTPPLVMEPPGFFVGYTTPAGTVGAPAAGAPGFYGASSDFTNSSAVTSFSRLYARGWYAGMVSGPTAPLSAMIASAQAANLYPDIEYYSNGCALPGDSDGDGRVDGADLGRLLGAWGPATASSSVCDLNADGSVDGADLAILLGNFAP